MTTEIKPIDIDKLLLDDENPRLPTSVDRDQQSMRDYIADTTAIEELMDAIAENDFFSGEPLIVVKHPAQKGMFTVVEGNRRLTALKLLQDPSYCSSPGSRMEEIAKNAKFKPSTVPVVICKSRADVLPYLGFRHITGIKQWEPLAKARYIEQLFNLTDQSAPPKIRYKQVARTIGSRLDHIKRSLDALAVYNVINEHDFYNIDGLSERTIKFAVLSTAIGYDNIGTFVGVAIKDAYGDVISQEPIVNPEAIHKEAVLEFTVWLYKKDEKGRTRVGESRNLRELAAVVANPSALKAFRNGSPLKIAYQQTSNVIEDFLDLLYKAEGCLTEAASMVATVDYDEDALLVARRISETIKLVGRALREKRRNDEDDF